MAIEAAVFKDEAVEREARKAISLEEANALLTRFSTLVRESGLPDEAAAGTYVVERLKTLGIPFTLHTPELFLSIPGPAELYVIDSEGERAIRCRPPAFSRSTSEAGITGEIVYVPSKYAGGTADLFDTPDAAHSSVRDGDPLMGKIVVTEGYAMPGPVSAFERRGAMAQIYIHAGEQIHEGICTTIWGAPTDESISRKPRTPIVCINRTDGIELIAAARRGVVRATIRTELREGWAPCLLP